MSRVLIEWNAPISRISPREDGLVRSGDRDKVEGLARTGHNEIHV